MRIESLMCNALRADPIGLSFITRMLESAAAIGNDTLVMLKNVWYHFRASHVDLTLRKSAGQPKDYKYMSVLAAECTVPDTPAPYASDENNFALKAIHKHIKIVVGLDTAPPSVLKHIKELKAKSASVPAPAAIVVGPPLPVPAPSARVDTPAAYGTRGKRAAAYNELPEDNSKLDLDAKKQRKFASNLELLENIPLVAPAPAPAAAKAAKTNRCRKGKK